MFSVKFVIHCIENPSNPRYIFLNVYSFEKTFIYGESSVLASKYGKRFEIR